MKVLLISGSHPPDPCGIGDYTATLYASLIKAGLDADELRGMTWRLSAVGKIVASIRKTKSDIIHLQYPGEGYGWSVTPQIVSLLVPAVVTLHEFSFSRLPRKLACLPFLFFSRHIVFTTIYEREFVCRVFPWIEAKSSVIPIGTNVQPSNAQAKRSFDEVVYFGLIAPNKGLEKVIELAEIAKQSNDGIRVRIVGRKVPRFEGYAGHLIAKSGNLPITFELDKSSSEVAEILASSSVAFLPFPDGASERRGSLKAVLSSGLACISTEGVHTTVELRQAIIICETAEEAYVKAKSILNDRQSWDTISANCRSYVDSFKWDRIAEMHIELYSKLTRR